jgi:hypothetical protein
MNEKWQVLAHSSGYQPDRPGGYGLVHQAGGLLGQALASEDAETGGLRADDVLASAEIALMLLGRPDAWASARHAVVQRYGRVGALLVVGYEGRWRANHRQPGPTNPPELEQLLDRFSDIDASELQELLARLDQSEGVDPGDEEAQARRRLHATFAVAARDGSNSAHRAYMEALDRVMRLAAPRLAV